MENKTLPQSLHEHKSSELRPSKSHVDSLVYQGIIAKSIDAVITNSYIQEWSNITLSLPESIFQFTRKSLLQLLPTASNLHRWKRTDNPLCTLCNKGVHQTNKHVLSNSSSVSALSRYTKRHNDILSILVHWINKQNMQNSNLYSDLDDIMNNPVVEVFQPNVRPDIVIIQKHSVYGLELTVWNETNLEKSCKFKTEKYKNLNHFRCTFSLSKFQYTVSWQTTSRPSLPELKYTIPFTFANSINPYSNF